MTLAHILYPETTMLWPHKGSVICLLTENKGWIMTTYICIQNKFLHQPTLHLLHSISSLPFVPICYMCCWEHHSMTKMYPLSCIVTRNKSLQLGAIMFLCSCGTKLSQGWMIFSIWQRSYVHWDDPQTLQSPLLPFLCHFPFLSHYSVCWQVAIWQKGWVHQEGLQVIGMPLLPFLCLMITQRQVHLYYSVCFTRLGSAKNRVIRNSFPLQPLNSFNSFIANWLTNPFCQELD